MSLHKIPGLFRTLFAGSALSLALMVLPNAANAALITGTMSLAGGAYTLTGGTDFSDATGISFDSSSIIATGATDLLGTTVVGFSTTGNVQNFSFDPLSASISGFINIGGWSLQLDTAAAATPRTTGALFISGTGILSGNAADPTAALWSFSSNNLGDYSMTVSVAPVPVPAAVWLFASGLIGLVSVARRKPGAV